MYNDDDVTIRYRCWFDKDAHSNLFGDFDSAYEFALDNDCTEIERLIWYSNEDACEYYYVADDFEIVWRR